MGRAAALALMTALTVACQPTVRLQAPEEPMTINMNIKIEQEVRVKVERDVEELFEEREDIF